jgi:ABC-type glycerol-3-phosphate transport system substrate-binding protein/DNA-binding transcriptional regulator YhcF (GntR family)
MKRSYTPLYIRIKSDIISKISSGELKKGDRLPAERELAENLGVSRITVVGALKELADEGIIRKAPGSGSYISCEKLEEDYEDIFSQITGRAKVEISFGLRNADPCYELLIRTLAGLFQLEHPDIKVRVENIHIHPHEKDDIYLFKIGGGNAPSVGELFMYSDYALINGLVPLENLPGFQNLASAIPPHCFYETVNADEEKHIHALPFKLNIRTIFVNVDLLKEAGIKDFDAPLDRELLREWVALLGKHTKRKSSGEYGISLEVPDGWHGVVGQFPYLWKSRGEFSNSLAGFRELLESQAAQNGIDFLSDLYKCGNPSPIDGLDLFAAGRVGLLVSGGIWPLFLNRMMVKKFQIKAFPIPSEEKGVDAPSVLGSYSLGIFRSAVKSEAELEAAWKWIKYLFRKKQQYWITSNDFSFPVLNSNMPCALKKEYPELYPVLAKALNGSITQFDCHNIHKAMFLFGKELKKRFNGETGSVACIENSLRSIEQLELL